MRREASGGVVLNGVNQFVELPKDIADLHDCTYTIDFKWAGGVGDQRLFEFANSRGDSICLCPSLKGKLLFGIRQSGKVEYVTAAGVRPDVWQTVRIVLADKCATLYLNGEKVAENKAMTLTPESVRATQCYLGRGFQRRVLQRHDRPLHDPRAFRGGQSMRASNDSLVPVKNEGLG